MRLNDLDLIIDPHRTSDRLGPGSDKKPRRALKLTGRRFRDCYSYGFYIARRG